MQLWKMMPFDLPECSSKCAPKTTTRPLLDPQEGENNLSEFYLSLI